MAVTPWGDLYPCHQFVGDPKYLMGDIWKGVTNTAVRDEFKHCNAYARKECQDCWAKLYCSGGCAANAYHATGSISSFVISVLGACVCIWVDNRLFHDR